MGNSDSKLNFRKAIVQLTQKSENINPGDNEFWKQFWYGHDTSLDDLFALVTAQEMRKIRNENPMHFATLCYKAVEKLAQAVDTSCRTPMEQQCVLNCVRILIRIIPYIFEDTKWKNFFWESLPNNVAIAVTGSRNKPNEFSNKPLVPNQHIPLAQSLLNAICDLLFCPEFTVAPIKRVGPEKADELLNIDSCEYIWEAGVGFAKSPTKTASMEKRRMELLKLLLVCFSEPMYFAAKDLNEPNKWISYFTSAENRHALPLFTSLLNTVCAYDPVGLGVPYNHLLFTDLTEPLVEACLQLLIVTLDHWNVYKPNLDSDHQQKIFIDANISQPSEDCIHDNLFINYLSRVHRDEDFQFILKGITRLLNNPLIQSYLPNSTRKLYCHQELLILFWKVCDYNKKFLYFVLKSSDVLDILIPILYHLNYSRADQSKVGLMHIGVFILLLLSGERNFGVRLNKPYTATVPMDIPVFTGTHADLLITVFHKIIATGHQRLQPLFDCLLTILVNVSPYLKTLSMVASVKLLHLLEAFSTPWFLLSAPNNHHLVFFLLEIFNNIIQYQFDGNSNLIYTIIRKRHVFHAMANLPTDMAGISKCLSGRKVGLVDFAPNSQRTFAVTTQSCHSQLKSEEYEPNVGKTESEHNSPEAYVSGLNAGSESLQASLFETPRISKMTERESTIITDRILLSGSSDASNDDEKTPPFSKEHKALFQSKSPLESYVNDVQNELKIISRKNSIQHVSLHDENWTPTTEWIASWRSKLPLQTIMRLLQVLVPQVEKICIDKGLTDESEILKFLQHGTLVGLLPVPHPILIRKYQANSDTTAWFRTYIWGVIYLRNTDPAIWYESKVRLFEIQRV